MRFVVYGLIVCGTASQLVVAADSPTWPIYANETPNRLVADAGVGVSDIEEKDYAWGDVDQDGDIDLVCVRKQPWNTTGRRRNVLFMNEGQAEGHPINGVLVDRTAQYAVEASDGGQGFLDLTNDRDVALIDVNGDGWLDMVTATTYGQGLPKTISHPRIYVNKGEAAGLWQGFRYEEPRTPAMPIAPNFCSVAVGDVTADGSPDLYFTDYNNTLEDRLWVNNGGGAFSDVSESALTYQMRESDFGVRAVIADMNDDGAPDIVKDRGSTNTVPPLRISVSYNNPKNQGVFNIFDVIYNGNPYHVEVGDLNGDGKLDLVVDDDGLDRYFLNQGNGLDGLANFQTLSFPAESNLFGGNIVIRDIDQDGHLDVLIADVDVDCCGCVRHMHVWRNQGDVPAITFAEQSGGIPISARTGTFDVAVFDINGDAWLDMVIGTCTGTSIWIAQPRLNFSYPQGLPAAVISPHEPLNFHVNIQQMGGAVVDTASAMLHVSVNNGPYSAIPLAPVSGSLFQATIPPVPCVDKVAFYLSASTVSGVTYLDPSNAPTGGVHRLISASGTRTALADQIEGDVVAWTVISDPSLSAGAWQQAQPNGTIVNSVVAAPFTDATPPPGVLAFVTQNGAAGGAANVSDVDGGPTHLISPVLDLIESDAIISYHRWFHSSSGSIDSLTVSLSNDGGASWVNVDTQTTGSTNGAWQAASFIVGAFVAPTANVQVRFTTADLPNNSVTEAGIDDFQVDRIVCDALCPADIAPLAKGDGQVNVDDLLMVINEWGNAASPADVNQNGTVDVNDLLGIISAWGPCF